MKRTVVVGFPTSKVPHTWKGLLMSKIDARHADSQHNTNGTSTATHALRSVPHNGAGHNGLHAHTTALHMYDAAAAVHPGRNMKSGGHHRKA